MNGMTSQEMFEAMFDHKPKIDTRTPQDVAAGMPIFAKEAQ